MIETATTDGRGMFPIPHSPLFTSKIKSRIINAANKNGLLIFLKDKAHTHLCGKNKRNAFDNVDIRQ